MKRLFVLALVLIMIITATAAYATVANTKHNLTSTSGNSVQASGAQGETLCGFCHVPHGGSTAVANLPLWARTANTGISYTVYGTGSTLSGTTVDQPGAFSLTCLSCHDAQTALGQMYKYGSALSIINMTGGVGVGPLVDNLPGPDSSVIGLDLSDDHPVGLVYDSTAVFAGLTNSVTPNGSDGLVNNTYPIYGGVDGSGTLECSSCHDPHLEDSGTSQTKFLRSLNATICQGCHTTK